MYTVYYIAACSKRRERNVNADLTNENKWKQVIIIITIIITSVYIKYIK